MRLPQCSLGRQDCDVGMVGPPASGTDTDLLMFASWIASLPGTASLFSQDPG